MDRRDFITRTLLGSAATLALPPGARAAAADPTQAAFDAARAGRPWTLGFAGLQTDAAPMPLQMLHGRMPRDLQGAFWRNGPARHAVGGQRYHHVFDGDGMLQRYTVAGGAVMHQGRFVRTEKWLADTAAGRPVRATFGTNPPGADPVNSPDSINPANTSVLHHGGELLALWEGGSAIRLDEATLATRGPKVWSSDYAGMPFSAHPKLDGDGTLWNFGVSSFRGLLSIYRIGAGGSLQTATTIPVPQIAMVHDFAITARHLVFLLPPLVFDRDRAAAGATFLDSHVWRPELGLRVLVLKKDQLDAPIWFDLPAGFVFHVGNAWDDGGTIRLDYIRSRTAWHATVRLKELMRGEYNAPHGPGEPGPPSAGERVARQSRIDPRDDGEDATVTQVTLDLPSRRATQTVLPQLSEFPRVDPRVVGVRHGQLYTALRLAPGDRPGYDAVMRMDLAQGSVDHWRYGADVMVEEHIVVPRPGSRREGDGWVVGTALDLARQRMLFSVFDAMHLADGPLAQAALDRVMPLGLHAIFVAG